MVDASVSKTDEVTLVPVRSRPRVQLNPESLRSKLSGFFSLKIFSKFSEILKIFCYFCKSFSETKFMMKKILLGLLLVALFVIGLFS